MNYGKKAVWIFLCIMVAMVDLFISSVNICRADSSMNACIDYQNDYNGRIEGEGISSRVTLIDIVHYCDERVFNKGASTEKVLRVSLHHSPFPILWLLAAMAFFVFIITRNGVAILFTLVALVISMFSIAHMSVSTPVASVTACVVIFIIISFTVFIADTVFGAYEEKGRVTMLCGIIFYELMVFVAVMVYIPLLSPLLQ